MDVVELSDEVRETLGWNFLDDVSLDQDVKDFLLGHVLDLFIAW